MKRKELKQLAQKIAKFELIIQKGENIEKVSQAKKEIMQLSGCVDNIDDMLLLDDMIQELLEKGFDN